MNRAFQIVWNRAVDAWMVVAENVRTGGRPLSLTLRGPILAAVVIMSAGSANALPTAPQVVNGTVGINTAGQTMTVTNSPNAIINWGSFSIASGETARFMQQSAASSVLNRVTGGDPSRIYGALQSNGKVFLINQNGLLFGAGAKIDVNGLVASSLNISNDDFLAGRMKFTAADLAGKVENHGVITTPSRGEVYLIAPDVSNSGIITAPNGDILLAAGSEVLLVEKNTPEIALVVSAPQNQSINLGSLTASAGRIGMYGGLVRQGGAVSADSAIKDASGRIFLKATSQALLEKGSSTAANGISGGTVTVHGGEGEALVSGTVEAKGSEGIGGTVQLLGKQVGLIDTAAVDVSGVAGGGTVLAGGGYQGKSIGVQNAQATFMGRDATIKADGTGSGSGGRVILWSDEATRAYGSISAKSAGGSTGGFVETSGGYLDVSGISVSAGTWLLDPNNITVSSGTDTNIIGGPTFTTSGDGAIISASTIQTALNNGTSVSLTTGTAPPGYDAGDIQVTAPITKSGGGAATLSLNAHRNISINSSITSTSDKLNVTLNADSDASGGGAIRVYNTTINSNGGNIIMGGQSNPSTAAASGSSDYTQHGISIDNASILSGGGSITMNGRGYGGGYGSAYGVHLKRSSVASSGGDITINGVGGGSYSGLNDGVYITGESGYDTSVYPPGTIYYGTHIEANGGGIRISGTGGASGMYPGTGSNGIVLNNFSKIESVSASSLPSSRVELFGSGTNYGLSAGGVFIDSGSVNAGKFLYIYGGNQSSVSDIVLNENASIGGGEIRLTTAGTIKFGGGKVGNATATGLLPATTSIEIHADNVAGSGTTLTVATGDIQNEIGIAPATSGRTVGVAGGSGDLQISQALLDKISAPTLVIGNMIELENPAASIPVLKRDHVVSGAMEVGNLLWSGGQRLGLLSGSGISSATGTRLKLPDADGGMAAISGGSVNLSTEVRNIAIESAGAIDINNSGNLNIVSVTGGRENPKTINGISASGWKLAGSTPILNGGANVKVAATGDLSVNAPVYAEGSIAELVAGGDISGTAVGVVSGVGLNISAGTSVGSSTQPLVSDVYALTAQTSGDLFIKDGGEKASPLIVYGIDSGAGAVFLKASGGGINIDGNVNAGAAINIEAAGDLNQVSGVVSNLGGASPADISLKGNSLYLNDIRSKRHLAIDASGDLSLGMNWSAYSYVDDDYFTYTLPFGFTFFGQTYNVAYISSNGLVSFGSGISAYSDNAASLASYKAIAAAWNDWEINPQIGRNIFISKPAPGSLAVKWDVERYPTSGKTAIFETVLNADGAINFNYGAANSSFAGDVTIGLANGSTALVSQLMNQTGFSMNNLKSTTFTPSGNSYVETIGASGGLLSSALPILTGTTAFGLSEGQAAFGLQAVSNITANVYGNINLGSYVSSTQGGSITLASNTGSIFIGKPINAGGSGNVKLNATSGSITASNSDISVIGNAVEATAGTDIGTSSAPLSTEVQQWSRLDAAGSVFAQNVGDVSTSANQVRSATGDVFLKTSGSMDIGSGGVQAAGKAFISAGAGRSDTSITLSGAVRAFGGGEAIVIDAGNGSFINSVGSNALNTDGAGSRWLVYSADPAKNVFGGLVSGNIPLWGSSYVTSPPSSVAAGKRYLFAMTPVLTATVNGGNITKPYGTLLSPPSTSITGLVNAAAYGNVFTQESYTGSGVALSDGFAATAPVQGGVPYLVTVLGNLTAPAGYGPTIFNNVNLTVNPAEIVMYEIGASLTGTASKVYDGTNVATLTPANFMLSGFAGTDSAAVTKTTGTYGSKNAGSGIEVRTTLIPSDFAPTGSTNLSNYTLPTAASGNIGVITPAPITAVTGFTASDKVYDGLAAATINGTAALFAGMVSGDNLTVNSATGSFDSRHAGTGKTVNISGITLGGSDAGNYTLTKTTSSAIANISVRPLSTWIATGSGLWNDAANWDALPDASNVREVAISSGGSRQITFDGGSTSIEKLSSGQTLLVTGGTMSVSSSLVTSGLQQSGGSIVGTGSLQVSDSFNQTGGAISLAGTAALVKLSGDIAVSGITASAVTLTAPTGGISQTGPIAASTLATQSATGTVLDGANRVADFTASNSSTGNIILKNTAAPLTLGAITQQGSGSITIENRGAIITGVQPVTSGGTVSLTAKSPLTIGSGGVSGAGGVTLVASASGGADTLTVNGPITSSGGNVTLEAGSAIVVNSTVTAPSGSISKSENKNTATTAAAATNPIVQESATPTTSVAPAGLELVALAPQEEPAPSAKQQSVEEKEKEKEKMTGSQEGTPKSGDKNVALAPPEEPAPPPMQQSGEEKEKEKEKTTGSQEETPKSGDKKDGKPAKNYCN